MADPRTSWIDELAKKSPTALSMALERALEDGDRDLERAVVTALEQLGIAVVDRTKLVETITDAKHKRRRR